MRRFKSSMLFMGSESSEREAALLKRRLEAALSHLSGLQQPAHSESEAQAKQNEAQNQAAEREIEDAVRDIAMALTGKEITFV